MIQVGLFSCVYLFIHDDSYGSHDSHSPWFFSQLQKCKAWLPKIKDATGWVFIEDHDIEIVALEFYQDLFSWSGTAQQEEVMLRASFDMAADLLRPYTVTL